MDFSREKKNHFHEIFIFSDVIVKFQPGECEHPTVMKNMCAECGADLQQEMSMVPSTSSKPSNVPASISIVHSIPELKVSSNVNYHYSINFH